MVKPKLSNVLLAALSALSLVGCENIPASKGTQGAVVGGTGGAAVGALAGGEHHRLLGALIGGAVGTAGGYVVGANSDRILGRDQNGAQAAAQRSQEHPATPQEALRATTADINGDGFVTMDEIAAMRDAGLTDAQMLDRMRATGQVFELTPDQRQYLLNRGVSQFVVDQMEGINRSTRERLLNSPAPVAPPVGVPQSSAPPYPAPAYPPPAPATPAYPPPYAAPPTTTPPVVGQPPPY